MNKFKTALLSFTALFLVFAVVLGIVTRNSYKEFESYDEVEFDVSTFEMRTDSLFEHLNKKRLLSNLKKAENAFVVTVLDHNRVSYATQTIVHVDEVIKGDKTVKGTSILIYGDGYIEYSKNSKTFYYSTVYSPLNNIMKTGESYLVFCKSQEYHPEFQKKLKYKEFVTSINDATSEFYYFPLNYTKSYIDKKKVESYNDVKDMDYFCFTEEQADMVEDTVNLVLKTYLKNNPIISEKTNNKPLTNVPISDKLFEQ